ncbi:MAG TPA: hypothetical protein PLH93_10300 [Flavobacteriales bacterium]|nr:hypothetical protein [Flavobacteriales bacterium]HQW87568.1 hypothetical protein [Flavobacteriales bacterium]
MRHSTLLIPALLTASLASAQIPNGGFENWTNNVNYMEPADWWTTNAVTHLLAGTASCVPGTPGAVGNHHIAITSMTAGTIVEVGRATCGNELTGYPGFPYAARPATFEGQVQYAPQGGDAAMVHAALWGWNSQMTAREVIAVATFNITAAIPTWQSFSIPFSYLSSNTPDTARVFIEASMNTPVDGTTILVDDLHFDGAVGVMELEPVAGLSVQPNPVADHAWVTATEPLTHVTVQDADGRVVLDRPVNALGTDLDVDGWVPGLYAVRVFATDGRTGVRRLVKL